MWSVWNQPSAESPGARPPQRLRCRRKAAARSRRARPRGRPPAPCEPLCRRRCRASPAASAAARPRPRCALARTFSRRKPRRLAGHHGDARGEGAHAVVDAVGLAVHDADARDSRPRAHRRRSARSRSRCPGPTEAAPVTTSTAPSVSTVDPHAVERPEPALLHEHAQRRRRPVRRLARAAARRAAAPSQSIGGQRLVEQRRHSRRNRTRPRCRACRAAARRASRPWRSDCAAAPRPRSMPSCAAIASISRSRTKVLS